MSTLQRKENYRNELLNRKLKKDLQPFIFAGAIAHWPAINLWTPEYFKEKYRDLVIAANIEVPSNKAPYLFKSKDYTSYVTIEKFVDLMLSGKSCYIAQEDINLFPHLQDKYNFQPLIPSEAQKSSISVNFWMGNHTRSGLHFDNKDNFLSQIYGSKKVFLISPMDTAFVYPIPENFLKSPVDPSKPDYYKYPLLKKAQILEGEINPGETLFIPKGWWHYIYSPRSSISLNCWYGKPLSVKDYLRILRRCSWQTYIAFIRSFLWHGLLHQPFETHLYSPPPSGKIAYDIVVSMIKNQKNPYM